MKEIEFLVRLLLRHGLVATVPYTMGPCGFAEMIHRGSELPVTESDLSGITKAAACLLGLLTLRKEGTITEEEFLKQGGGKLRKEIKKAPKSYSPERSASIIERLGSKIPNSSFRYSRQGVPLLVVNNTHSVCWFGSTQVFRVFDNWMNFNEKQKRWDFPDEAGVLEFFKLLSVAS